MQIIQIHEKSLGNLDWELPKRLSLALSMIPEEQRTLILTEMTDQLRGFLHMLHEALLMGPLALQAMELINTNQLELSEQLITMCEEAEKKT